MRLWATGAGLYRVRQEISACQDLARRIEPHAGPQVRGLINGMRNWMRGYQDSVFNDTRRHHTQHAEHEANDSPVAYDVRCVGRSRNPLVSLRAGTIGDRLGGFDFVPQQTRTALTCRLVPNAAVDRVVPVPSRPSWHVAIHRPSDPRL
ncbi:hypothetical protein AV521_15520 [Streptomyces sp. IMTB 2501]|nr:hypothetical protein AV521_15520 [Streptomyces sp. IMTB 2501]